MEFVKVPTIRDRHIIEDALQEYLFVTRLHVLIDLEKKLQDAIEKLEDEEIIQQIEEDIREEKKLRERVRFLLNNVVQERD